MFALHWEKALPPDPSPLPRSCLIFVSVFVVLRSEHVRPLQATAAISGNFLHWIFECSPVDYFLLLQVLRAFGQEISPKSGENCPTSERRRMRKWSRCRTSWPLSCETSSPPCCEGTLPAACGQPRSGRLDELRWWAATLRGKKTSKSRRPEEDGDRAETEKKIKHEPRWKKKGESPAKEHACGRHEEVLYPWDLPHFSLVQKWCAALFQKWCTAGETSLPVKSQVMAWGRSVISQERG